MTELPEFSRRIPLAAASQSGARRIEADAAERAALSERFGLVAVDRLEAEFDLVRDGESYIASGRVQADVTQSCVATGDPVAARIDETVALRFVSPGREAVSEEEIELGAEQLDDIAHDDEAIDLGEAAAQTVMLALDPFPRSTDARTALRQAGVLSEEEAGAFGALKELRDRMGGSNS